MALADAFLADLDEEEADDLNEESENASSSSSSSSSSTSETPDFGFMPGLAETVFDVAKLTRSDRYKRSMESIDSYDEEIKKEKIGHIEDDPEYKVVVESNELAAEITSEILLVHHFIHGIYSKKFPDLSTLVPTPIEYIQTVQKIGGETDLTLVDLTDVLPPAHLLAVVTAATAGGKELTPEELRKVDQACSEAMDLQEGRLKILSFVERRMTYIAPNLSKLVGPEVAARLMAEAGGLTALSLMPACNIQNIGARRKHLAGFSSRRLQHAGYIYDSELIQTAPPSLQTKAIRMVTSRAILAARVDSFNDSPAGETGKGFYDEIAKKIEKFNEPPPAKKEKALPVPDMVRKKRRAGRRYRKQKELLAMTEMRKQANRVKFGEEAQNEYMGEDLGMLGTGSGGTGAKLKVAIRENSGQKLSRKRQRQLEKESGFKTSGFKTARYGGTTSTVNGFTSSFAMTPVQGLELTNPEAAGGGGGAGGMEQKVKEANQNYFSETSGFLKVGKDEKMKD